MGWKGIVGKLYDLPALENYLANTRLNLWRPKFIVVHNTSAPDLVTWAKWRVRKSPSPEQWARNLEGYYRDQQHWQAGPHLFVTPDGILLFTPLTTSGVHSPSWNGVSWGVETVGEFEREDPAPVWDNLVGALALLHAYSGLSPRPYVKGASGLHFHKEDPRTTHKSCPGRKLIKTALVDAVEKKISTIHGTSSHHEAPVVKGK